MEDQDIGRSYSPRRSDTPPILRSDTPPLPCISRTNTPPGTPPTNAGTTTPPIPKSIKKKAGAPDRELNLSSPCNYEALECELDNEQLEGDINERIAEEQRETLRKKKRFQKLIRLIVRNKLWATEAVTKQDKKEGKDADFKTDNGEKLTFNSNAYKAHVQTCGNLSAEAIAILSKPSRMRNEEEIKVVQKILFRLKCFDRYSLHIKQGLARVIDYDKFEDGRLIVRQGHPGNSFYFIVSGSVVVDRREYDPFACEFYNQRVAELTAGDSFGELALLHNTKRTASIRCRGTSEFLRVDKPDFDEVLRNSHQREWEIRINLLSAHPVFTGWSTRELKIANGHSKMKIYPPNMVLVSEDKPYPDRVFFIASGSCVVVRRLDLIKRMISKTKYKYILPPLPRSPPSSAPITSTTTTTPTSTTPTTTTTPTETTRTPTEKKVRSGKSKGPSYPKDIREQRFFTIAELKENDFFNVGEDLEGLYVISVGRVEVVQIATLAFARHSSGRLMDEMKRKYLEFLPTGRAAFEQYVNDRRWECFKKNTVVEATQKRKVSSQVNCTDVPGIINPGQVYYCHGADIL